MKKMLLVGNGRMGSSLGIQFKNTFDMSIVDPLNAPEYKAKHYLYIDEVQDRYDYITFAVKPFMLPEVISKMNKFTYDKNTEILSVIAGVKRDYYQYKLGEDTNITILMTNLAAKVGKGIVVVNSKNRHDFLNDCGQVIYTNTEDEIDKFCAFIGSGPGFCYSIMEMMNKASGKLGFKSQVDNENVIIELFENSIEHLKAESKSFKTEKFAKCLDSEVTATALAELEQSQKAFDKTLLKAYERAKELGELVRKSI